MKRRIHAVALIVALSIGGACSTEPEPLEPSASPVFESSSPDPAAPAGNSDSSAKLVGPEAASAKLFDAWKKGDRVAAAEFAEPAAVEYLLSRKYTGPDPEIMGCEEEEGNFFCRYRFEASSMTFRLDGGVSTGYKVTEVTERAD